VALLDSANIAYFAFLELYTYCVRNSVVVVSAENRLAQARPSSVSGCSQLFLDALHLEFVTRNLLRSHTAATQTQTGIPQSNESPLRFNAGKEPDWHRSTLSVLGRLWARAFFGYHWFVLCGLVDLLDHRADTHFCRPVFSSAPSPGVSGWSVGGNGRGLLLQFLNLGQGGLGEHQGGDPSRVPRGQARARLNSEPQSRVGCDVSVLTSHTVAKSDWLLLPGEDWERRAEAPDRAGPRPIVRLGDRSGSGFLWLD
jgi:hypothetical protein